MITVVYRLYFKNIDGEYIGKSSDFKRRISDHKRNMKKPNKTRLAKWIYENRNKELSFDILGEYDNDKDALIKESEEILDRIKKDKLILNSTLDLNIQSTVEKTQKLIERSRKSCSRKYILIDKTGKIYRAFSLRQWAQIKNLNYKDLNACARGKLKSSQSYKVFYREDWKKFSKKDKLDIISRFRIYDSNKESGKSRMKTFWITYKNMITKITNIKRFAIENNLNVEGLYLTSKKKQKQYKGYSVFSTEKEATESIERLQEEIPVANSFNSEEPQTSKVVGNSEPSSNREGATTSRKTYIQVGGNGECPKG